MTSPEAITTRWRAEATRSARQGAKEQPLNRQLWTTPSTTPSAQRERTFPRATPHQGFTAISLAFAPPR